MRVFAPGKLVLAGAYAVLEGEPALVCAVSRGAIASGTATECAYEEVRAAKVAFAELDVHALYAEGQKLGLGASAAALVATLGLRMAESGKDISREDVRAELFARALAAHGEAQGGGSGIDVAASVYGGVLTYVRGERPTPTKLPEGVVVRAYFAGRSASTRDLRARVSAAAERDPAAYALHVGALGRASREAAAACRAGSASDFVAACQSTGAALAALGAFADAAIVPEDVALAGAEARSAGAAFFPSGAGGGDTCIFVGTRGPEPAFHQNLERRGMVPLPFSVDEAGARTLVNSLEFQ